MRIHDREERTVAGRPHQLSATERHRKKQSKKNLRVVRAQGAPREKVQDFDVTLSLQQEEEFNRTRESEKRRLALAFSDAS